MRALLLVLIVSAAVFPAYRYKKQEDKTKPAAQSPTLEPVTPAYQAKAKDLFGKGLELFRKGGFADAAVPFKQVLKKYGRSAVSEDAAILLAQCYIRAGDYEEARWIINLFPKEYPKSVHLPRCAYLLGVVRACEGDHFGAARNFLWVVYRSPNPDLARLAQDALVLLFKQVLTSDQVLDLAEKMEKGSELKGYAVYYAALISQNQRKYERTAELLADFGGAYAGHPLAAKAGELAALAGEKKEAVVKIGVLLPFTAENSFYNEVGQSVFKGIRLAVQQHNQASAIKVKIVVKDTRANPVEAYHKTKELIEQEKVAALIGPLSSEEVCVTAALAEQAGVAVVSPTASAIGIDSLGSHVFQLTPAKSSIMRRLAEYACDSLKVSDYAVIFPNDDYGSVMASAFRGFMEEKGAELLAYEMYMKGEKNFKPILARLHDKMVERVFEKRAMENGEILGKMDERWIEVDSSFMEDSTVRVGAIFMPGYPEEVIMLGPQIPFYKIKARMLGEMGWYDNLVLRHAARYLDSAVISVDFVRTPDSKYWKAFQERFSAQFREAPDVRAGLGYDATRLILSAVKEDNGALLKRMQGISEFQGASTLFSFDPRWRANRTAFLLRIEDEEFVPILSR